jgi:dihydrolipoamide dehydrogenase
LDKLQTRIAVLGGGPAGYVAAIRAAQLGADVALIEEGELGGVCLNRGCIPTKTLLKNSDTVSLARNFREYGLEAQVSDINWSSAWSRKERVIKNLRLGLEQLVADHKIVIVRGKGTVVNPQEIEVSTPEGLVRVFCQDLILAVGSEPALPSIPGIELNGVITSNEALELKELPQSVVIIGAGVIGLEFADIFSGAGTKVTVIEMQDRILPGQDEECSAELLRILKRRKIAFKFNTRLKEIRPDHDSLQVIYEENGNEAVINAEKVLIATGRKFKTQTPDLIGLGIDFDSSGAILVNHKMETNIAHVYAAGDAVGGKLFAHLAFAEGKTAVENALGITSQLNYDAVPGCVYTHPELATVGLTESEAKNRGISIKVGRFDFRHNGRALTKGQRNGFVKVIINADNHIILGGHILGDEASEMISELTLAITLNARAEVLADMIHPHPTLSEAIMEACGDAIGRAIHKSR